MTLEEEVERIDNEVKQLVLFDLTKKNHCHKTVIEKLVFR